ncbi:hypothetical protein LEP1GSC052_0543 [Leptospira kmetyi serovar Malaysia str. Bejo-Iso9]|nr:hypothetical protein LEP1GSC052_0543 [Leptospira kmetyi serovar Malaysia str. Bejo-Iso9]
MSEFRPRLSAENFRKFPPNPPLLKKYFRATIHKVGIFRKEFF